MCIYIYIYIYTYGERERETETGREGEGEGTPGRPSSSSGRRAAAWSPFAARSAWEAGGTQLFRSDISLPLSLSLYIYI